MTPRANGIIGGAASAVLFIFLWVQKTWLNGTYMAFRGHPALAFLIIGLLLVLVAWILMDAGRPSVPLALAGVGLVVFSIFLFAYSGYAEAKRVNAMNEMLKPSDGTAQMPSYKVRAPYTIATQQTNDNITINGEAQNTTHIPALDKYGAPVVRSGWFKGYGQVVSQTIGESGQSQLEYCAFSDAAQDRLGGTFSHNLERRIMGEDMGILIDSDDSYAYCDEDGDPIVVVPFKKYDGFLFPIEVPAGVAIYDGATDELKVLHDVAVDSIPGPVYPISLAEKARKATTSANGWWNYIQTNTGFQEYGGENSGDYTLRRADDSGDSFVTPLTPVGTGKAITAVGYVESNGFKAGHLNTYNIALLPEARQGDGAVEDRVVNDYPELNWASGLKVFEITPTGPETWVATIGLNKAISYRLQINPDASSCLYNLHGTKIRCSGDQGTGGETTTGGSTPDIGDMSQEEFDAYLKSLSPEQFTALLKSMDRERDRRLTSYAAPSAE